MTKTVEVCGTELAFYNPDLDTIFYDRALNNYPNLKKAIIEHEEAHARDYPNAILMIKRDFIDYYKIRSKFSKEINEVKIDSQRMFHIKHVPLVYSIFAPILSLYAFILNCYFNNKASGVDFS